MKIRTYLAPDMRQALRLVREAQGPDAVILSSRRTEEGIEVVAAIDFEAEDRDAIAAAASAAPAAASSTSAQEAAAPRTTSGSASGKAHAPERATTSSPEDFAVIAQRALGAAEGGMGEELRTLRRMLETQLAALAWNDLSRRAPLQSELLRELAELGLAHDLAAELAGETTGIEDLTRARRQVFARLGERLAVTGDRWLDAGGAVALVGPTGVGKTTALAKLAARWVLRHGGRSLTLVSCDGARLGGHEQIRTLGQLLDAPTYTVGSLEELGELLPGLATRRFVLIDTPGLGQRDASLGARLAALAKASPRLETALVLAATTQAAALEETVQRYAPANPRCVLLTKLDEAASLGGVLSALLRSGSPLAYVSEGQRVPEDLRPARALELVARAVELARSAGASADEDALARRFGGAARATA